MGTTDGGGGSSSSSTTTTELRFRPRPIRSLLFFVVWPGLLIWSFVYMHQKVPSTTNLSHELGAGETLYLGNAPIMSATFVSNGPFTLSTRYENADRTIEAESKIDGRYWISNVASDQIGFHIVTATNTVQIVNANVHKGYQVRIETVNGISRNTETGLRLMMYLLRALLVIAWLITFAFMYAD